MDGKNAVVFLKFCFYIKNNLVNASELSDFLPPIIHKRYIACRIMKIIIYIFLLNFFIISLCSAQNSTKTKTGERNLDNDGLENIQLFIEMYEKKYKSSPMDYKIASYLGTLYLISENYERALDHYHSLLPIFKSKRTDILLKICEAYERKGEFENSFNILKHELDKCTKCSVFYLKLGDLCHKLQLHKEAYNSYSQIDTTELTPGFWYYSVYADICLKADTTLEMGIKFAKRAIKLKPEWAVYKILGDLLYRTENYKDALSAYEVVDKEFPLPEIKDKIIKINTLINQ